MSNDSILSGPVPFWKTKTLAEMTSAEWESLCDGCGKCCLHKLQYQDTGEIDYTDVACHLLDLATCRCSRYAARHRLVPDCVLLDARNVRELAWMPASCAYRLLAQGEDLPPWHPLVTGRPGSTHEAGRSVRGRAVSELHVGVLEDHVVSWPMS